MNFAFTDRARKVLALARQEAHRLRHDHVATEHLLLGLVRESEGLALVVLANLSVELETIREEIERSVRPGEAVAAPGEMPYASGAKKVLEYSMDEARRMRHDHVGTEHLLLGLLRSEQGIAAEVLGRFEVTLERARRETVRLLGAERPVRREGQASGVEWLWRLLGGAEPEGATKSSSAPIAIDNASSLSIYEQIVAQVQEAIATGRILPGDRLPTVRRLAEELDIAPGTVARAYSELERLGVVVTEGARGTRVASRPKRALPEAERPETLAGLLRPVAVAAFHLGASGEELRTALEQAMRGIFSDGGESAGAGG